MNARITKVLTLSSLLGTVAVCNAAGPCPPGKADSCSFDTVAAIPCTGSFAAGSSFYSATPLGPTYYTEVTCTNKGLLPPVTPSYTAECRDCDGDCVPHYGKFWYTTQACKTVCDQTYTELGQAFTVPFTQTIPSPQSVGIKNWFEVVPGTCLSYDPNKHPLGPKL